MDALIQRAAALFEGVIAPVILGEEIHPVKPIGPRLAARIAEVGPELRDLPGERLVEIVDLRRSRAERLIAVDQPLGFGRDEWRMAAALNDLLQTANANLSGALFSGRHEVLLRSARATLARVPSPMTIREVVSRHATFAKAPSLIRVDTEVSWWTGSALMRGEAPPRRLLAWPDLRRVETREIKVPLHDLAQHVPLDRSDWLRAIAEWLMRTPLTDLASAGREDPVFTWHPVVLQLVSSATGAGLARRVLANAGPRCDMAFERAAQQIESAEQLEIARRFLSYRRDHAGWSP